MIPTRMIAAVVALSSGAQAETQTHAPIVEHHHAHHHHTAHAHPARHAPRAPVHHEAATPPVVAPAKPVPPPPPPVGSVTGLALPRFASFRSEEVNMRSGPGTRYPIQWVYKRRDLPVEIEREFDVWRLVETDDGTKGWVHQATLIGNRTFIALAATGSGETANAGDLASAQTIRTEASAGAPAAAYLKPGVIGHVVACDAGSDWCRVEVHGTTGFLQRRAMWGLLPGEVVPAH